MQLQDAKALIMGEWMTPTKAGQWVDLGCGKGLFTQALGDLLAPGSTVYAVDNSKSALAKVPTPIAGKVLEKIHADFVHGSLRFQNLDGILMANSLHFVKDQPGFLRRVVNWLSLEGCFLIVEYDMDKGNYWVPYPVSYVKLKSLFGALGYTRVDRLHERPSVYQRGAIYSALVRKG